MELRLGWKLSDSQARVPERPSRREQMLSFEGTHSILCSSVVVLNSFGFFGSGSCFKGELESVMGTVFRCGSSNPYLSTVTARKLHLSVRE